MTEDTGTTFLRYLQLASTDAGECAIRTYSRRWFRVPRPLEEAVEMVRSLPVADHAALPDEIRELREMLIAGDSAAPLDPVPAKDATGSVVLAGAGALFDAVCLPGRAVPKVPLASLAEFAAGQPPAVVLLVPDVLDSEATREAATTLANLGCPFLPFFEFDGRGWLGPLVTPDGPVDIGDLTARLAANADTWPGSFADRVHELGAGADRTELNWMAAVADIELVRHLAGRPLRSAGHVLELDPCTLSVVRHPVLPWPVGPARPPVPEGTFTPESLVDARTGLVTRLHRFRHHADVPSSLVSVHAYVSKVRRVTHFQVDSATAGTSFESEEEARGAAIGEAVERYSGNVVRPEMLGQGSWRQLVERGDTALDPESLVLFSDRQYSSAGFPFVPFTRDLETYWVRGRSLTRGRAAWLPACMTYANWYTGPYRSSPPVSNLYFSGIAAGPTLEAAIASALLEAVERHSTMVWWSNAQPLASIRQFPADLAALWAGRPLESGQRTWLISLPNEFGIPVLAGVVEHPGDGLFTAGFAARPDPRRAALKAWAEALTLQDGARNLDRRNGGYRQAISRGDVPGRFLKPWRADRQYLKDYRPDFRDVVDLMCQLQIFLDPAAVAHVRPWVDTPAGMRVEDVPALPDGSLRGIREAIESRGFEIFYADLTTPDVRCTGLRVVRVIVPGLVGNFAAAFPYLGGGRLRRAAVELGWRSEPLAEEDVNLFPLPHA